MGLCSDEFAVLIRNTVGGREGCHAFGLKFAINMRNVAQFVSLKFPSRLHAILVVAQNTPPLVTRANFRPPTAIKVGNWRYFGKFSNPRWR